MFQKNVFQISDIINELDALFPQVTSCDYDNTGLVIGKPSEICTGIHVCVDILERDISYCISEDINLIISHHPLIWDGIKKINDNDSLSRKILKIIENGISVFALHTNYDSSPFGMCRKYIHDLSLSNVEKLEEIPISDLEKEKIDLNIRTTFPKSAGAAAEYGEKVAIDLDSPILKNYLDTNKPFDYLNYGVGVIGDLPVKYDLSTLASKLQQCFDISDVRLYDTKKDINRVAICPGSGKGVEKIVKEKGGDVLITGDISHDKWLWLYEEGVSGIFVDHYDAEKHFVSEIKSILGI